MPKATTVIAASALAISGLAFTSGAQAQSYYDGSSNRGSYSSNQYGNGQDSSNNGSRYGQYGSSADTSGSGR